MRERGRGAGIMAVQYRTIPYCSIAALAKGLMARRRALELLIGGLKGNKTNRADAKNS